MGEGESAATVEGAIWPGESAAPSTRWADLIAWTCEHGRGAVLSDGLVVEAEAGVLKAVLELGSLGSNVGELVRQGLGTGRRMAETSRAIGVGVAVGHIREGGTEGGGGGGAC